MTRPTLLALLAGLLFAAPAPAHDGSRTHQIRHLAVQAYGPAVCSEGTMRVPTIRQPGLRERWGTGALLVTERPYSASCLIYVNAQSWRTRVLCRVILREFARAAGRDQRAGREACDRAFR